MCSGSLLPMQRSCGVLRQLVRARWQPWLHSLVCPRCVPVWLSRSLLFTTLLLSLSCINVCPQPVLRHVPLRLQWLRFLLLEAGSWLRDQHAVAGGTPNQQGRPSARGHHAVRCGPRCVLRGLGRRGAHVLHRIPGAFKLKSSMTSYSLPWYTVFTICFMFCFPCKCRPTARDGSHGVQEPGCHTAGPHHAFKSVVPYPFNWNPSDFLPYRYNSIQD
jgi:hypothetical protein